MKQPKALFLQVTNPGAYPPLMHAGAILAEHGWDVTYLTSPSLQSNLTLSMKIGINEEFTSKRKDFTVSVLQYIEYCLRSIDLVVNLKPKVIYASDPIGTVPALMAKALSRGYLVYHEHDSPDDQAALHPVLKFARKLILNLADMVIFPNRARAEATRKEVPFPLERLQIVWNVPRIQEISAGSGADEKSFTFGLYFHGSIGPDKLPHTIIPTLIRFAGAVSLTLVGYETASGVGYVKALQDELVGTPAEGCIQYSGAMSRDELLRQAQLPTIGMALMPRTGANLNSANMTGASNKVFDYMSMGIIPLVSDLPDWIEAFVKPGFAISANPDCADSLYQAIDKLRNNNDLIETLRNRARAKILNDWNYDQLFCAEVLPLLLPKA